MKEAWVRLDRWSKEMVTTALESGADALVVPAGVEGGIKALGRITTVSPDGDLKPGVDVFFETLDSPADEARIVQSLGRGRIVIEASGFSAGNTSEGAPRTTPWEIIPLENLLARGGDILLPVRTIEEIDLALGILEKGVRGVVIQASTPGELKAMIARVKAAEEKVFPTVARITAIRPAGMGDRVCVDTCTLMTEGEGLLVGNSSGFLFLVQAESKPNPYVAPRPFRVNAGPVHAYVRVPGTLTRYLSELHSGDGVCVVDGKGSARAATVGRVKIERRPLLLIEADCEGVTGSILLQNAETIRLSRPDGKAVSVAGLAVGDSVLVCLEQAGRHFGIRVDETIREN
ncbi:MAG TPA: 3-dehydroquinate synthase II [Syntrophobacter fumaroxidans]|nr:3-dehydroquinate synthase II [Syntrophobacter fumaroxidans]